MITLIKSKPAKNHKIDINIQNYNALLCTNERYYLVTEQICKT